jgi:DNA invertase Pin-like site-specific DNA recombinase
MCGVFAEFEREMIRERVKVGLSRARADGKRLGRPRVSISVEQKIIARRLMGKGIVKIAKEIGVGVGTVQRIVRAQKPAASKESQG